MIPEENGPECYCLTCLWSGDDDQLLELPGSMFRRCPCCLNTDIVYLID